MILKRYTLATLAPLTLIELFSKMLKFSTKKEKKSKSKRFFWVKENILNFQEYSFLK